MSEKLEWEIEQIKKEQQINDKRLNIHDKKIATLQSFKDSTVEKLIMVFQSIDDLKSESKWTRRTLISTLIGGIISVFGAIIVWLIQS